MEEKESMNFGEWLEKITIVDVTNLLLMTVFTIAIIWLVIRTFRNKSSA